MKHPRLQFAVSFLAGALFAIGLVIAGMTQPQKIIGFLDPFQWDPSLFFVMMGAIGVHATAYIFIRKRAGPVLEDRWHIPQRRDLTSPLIAGSALFGIGWGLGGYCPGPSMAALTSGEASPIIFVGMMIMGIVIYEIFDRRSLNANQNWSPK